MEVLEFTANSTSKKIGMFVSIWKRNNEGITIPYSENDNFETMNIHCNQHGQVGRFEFPKSILLEKGIISSEKFRGKNGMRVYPSWVKPIVAQAITTQNWQLAYFKIVI